MKNIKLKATLVATLLAISLTAMAGNDDANACGNNGNNCTTTTGGGSQVGNTTATNGPVTNTNTANGGTGVSYSTSQGGNATGGTGGSSTVAGSGNSSNKIDNTNLNANTSNNKNTNSQGQSQSSNSTSGVKNSGNSSSASGVKNSGNSTSIQGQSTDNANNSKQAVTVTGDTVTYQAARIPVATAYAAGLSASNGTCLGSASGGIQAPMFGISGGKTTLDEGCNRRYNAQSLAGLGHVKAAVAILCQDESIKAAMESVGESCTGGTFVKAPVFAVIAEKQEYNDPIIRSRLGLPPLK